LGKKGCLTRFDASDSPSHFDKQRSKTKMSSPTQIPAVLANAKPSTGSAGDAGRQTAAVNSVSRADDPFTEYLQGYLQSYAPVGVPEGDLVRCLADNNWLLTHVHALERSFFVKLEGEENNEVAAEILKELRRTSNHAHRIQRAIEKTRDELKSMQSERKSAFAQAQEEAILLTQLAHAKGETLDVATDFPAPRPANGFVYSRAEILRILDREARLVEAKARFLVAA
jgi:hypothetical protein